MWILPLTSYDLQLKLPCMNIIRAAEFETAKSSHLGKGMENCNMKLWTWFFLHICVVFIPSVGASASHTPFLFLWNLPVGGAYRFYERLFDGAELNWMRSASLGLCFPFLISLIFNFEWCHWEKDETPFYIRRWLSFSKRCMGTDLGGSFQIK